MKKRPLLLRVMGFSPDEMESLVRCAVKIMHADNRLRLEEESIINLIPALLRIAKQEAGDNEKNEWRKKLLAALYAVKAHPSESEDELHRICHVITDQTKRSTCLVILFLIAGSDKHIDQREIDFIVNKIAKPWNFSIQELINLLIEDSEKIFIPEEMINYLKKMI